MHLLLEKPLAILGGDIVSVEITSRTAGDRVSFVFTGANGLSSSEGSVRLFARDEETAIAEKISEWLGVKARPCEPPAKE